MNGANYSSGGDCNVRLPLSRARDWKAAMKALRRNGVMIRNSKFFGFLIVRMTFLYINNHACAKKLSDTGRPYYGCG